MVFSCCRGKASGCGETLPLASSGLVLFQHDAYGTNQDENNGDERQTGDNGQRLYGFKASDLHQSEGKQAEQPAPENTVPACRLLICRQLPGGD